MLPWSLGVMWVCLLCFHEVCAKICSTLCFIYLTIEISYDNLPNISLRDTEWGISMVLLQGETEYSEKPTRPGDHKQSQVQILVLKP